ncbi:MAG: hypothetical protein ABJB97_04990 [Acidobacteriota bacterium]
MRVSIGLKAHSGWAALVVIGFSGRGLQVVDRRRLELVEPKNAGWAKQPYHAAAELEGEEARRVVERAFSEAHRIAGLELRGVVESIRTAQQKILGCAVLVGSPMPAWSIEQILSVHVRMHKAEGALFPQALLGAARACKLKVVEVPEKELGARVGELPSSIGPREILALGSSVGPPWGKDQKSAALAAISAFPGT